MPRRAAYGEGCAASSPEYEATWRCTAWIAARWSASSKGPAPRWFWCGPTMRAGPAGLAFATSRSGADPGPPAKGLGEELLSLGDQPGGREPIERPRSPCLSHFRGSLTVGDQ